MIVESVLNSLADYCGKQETREALESRVLAPVTQYLAAKFSWTVRLFQVVAVLVFVQTIILLWLLVREVRR
jgi:hypothetical protein